MGHLYAIGDIHGCFKPFYELVVKNIDLKKSDQLILLGDYIDRGYQSKEVIEFIIDLQRKGFNVTPLTGNHELMLVDAFNNPEMLNLWYMNGGETTLMSFGISEIRDLDHTYLNFFEGLEYFAAVRNYLFVHAGFNDYAGNPFSDRYEMVWECRTVYENPLLQGEIIIHGHRPKTVNYVKKLVSAKSAVIPIDTGCVYDEEAGYGFLSALDADKMELISVPNS